VSSVQRRARIFGVLYLITFVTSIRALVLYEPALRHPVGFIAGAGNVNKIYLGALLELHSCRGRGHGLGSSAGR
jgi:hypothetical protein